MKVDGLKIPQSHAEFAEAVSKLADEYGIDKFTMKYRPKFDSPANDGLDRQINGEMNIVYSSVDGRGRPCRNLSIVCDATINLTIEHNWPSSN